MENLNAVKYHMYFNIMCQIKKTAQKNMHITCFFMYYSLRDEIELFSSNPPTYSAKLAERGIIKVVNQNYSLVEPFATIVDDSFKRISSDIDNNMDPHG